MQQDLHSSATDLHNAAAAGDAIQLAFEIQKLSIIPQHHILVQSGLNEVRPSTDLPQGVVPMEHQDVNRTSFVENCFEIELNFAKSMVRILDDWKNHLRKKYQSLELSENTIKQEVDDLKKEVDGFKREVDDLLRRLPRLMKTAAELNHFNCACEIREMINHASGWEQMIM